MATPRALIIAIERYALIQEGLSPTLPGTHRNALAFRRWLLDVQGLAVADVFFCTEAPALEGRTSDATRKAIQQEILRLKQAGRDQTAALYVYVSGHGFSYTDVDGAPMADVLIAADYVRRGDSGDACLRLDEIQKWLKLCLGPGDHYYFVDACRNQISEHEIKVATLGLTYDFSAKKKATVYTLYSTTQGTLAPAGSSFPEVLIDGLNGKGRAKTWHEGTLAVLFDSLGAYAESRLGKELDPRKEGSNDGVIREFVPPPTYTCTIGVSNAGAQDIFQVEVKNEKGQAIDAFTFTGPRGTFVGVPDDYTVRLTAEQPSTAAVVPEGPVGVDLYEDCGLAFVKQPPGAGHGRARDVAAVVPSPADTHLRVVAPMRARVVVRNAQRVEVLNGTDVLEGRVPPGKYRFEVFDDRGMPVDRHDIELAAGDRDVDLSTFRDSPLRAALLNSIHGYHDRGAVDFSESMGPTPDQGLDLWLALVGAARIVGGPDDFSKLGPLPLTTFDQVPPDHAPLYVLAGFDDPAATVRVAASREWRTPPRLLVSHPGFPGLFEHVGSVSAPGHQYVTVQVNQTAPLTWSTFMLPNRVTLVTVTRADRQALRVQQFMLPLKHLMSRLPAQGGLDAPVGVGADLHEVGSPLRVVRRLVEVQRAFARSGALAGVLSTAELDALLDFRWEEPVVTLLSAYELVRRGRVDALPTLVNNLRGHFPGLPDTEALARLANLPSNVPPRPPLVLEGLQVLDLLDGRAGVPPSGQVDFRGPWSAWRAVTDPGP